MAMYMNRDAPGSGLANLMAMRGRYGDTELVHMNPMEVKMFDAMTPGGMTRNPDTGAPEGFAWWLPILGAAIGGIAGGAKGGGFKNVLKGAALGGLAGLGGAGFMSATGIGATAAGGMGSAWGPFAGLQGLFGGTGGAGLSSIAGSGVGAGGVGAGGAGTAFGAFGLPTGYASVPAATGIGGNVLAGTQAALGSTVPLNAVPHTMGMFGGVPPQAAISGTAITNPFLPQGMTTAPFAASTSSIAPNFSTPAAVRGKGPIQPEPSWWSKVNPFSSQAMSSEDKTTPATNAYEQTWMERNRLPITGAAMAGTLLANQGPTAADFPSGTARKDTESIPVTGRKVRELDEITGEEIEEGVEGEGLGAFFEEEDDIVENKDFG